MMTTSYISSINFWNAPRTGLSRLQTDLAATNSEIATGRYADVGLVLGTKVGTGLGLRQQSAEIDALKSGNGVATLRLKTTQSALAQMQSAADKLLASIVGQPEAQQTAVVETGSNQLTPLVSALNMTMAGQYVFGGANSGAAPIDMAAIDAMRQRLQTDFQAHFGYAPGSSAAATEDPAKVQAFLDTYVDGGFSGASWGGLSQASSAISSRIALNEEATTSASADARPFAQLTMAYVIASDFKLSSFSPNAQKVANQKVMSLLAAASSGLVTMQADLGRSQDRIAQANDRLDAQKTLLSGEVNDLEAVDPAAAKTKVDALTTQIQMSYALTAQLRQLSLVNYL
ncbi:flagellar hook-associated family protein [Methylobacterium komagatae]